MGANVYGIRPTFVITLTLLTLVEWGVVQPFRKEGFYCNDPKLAFKKNGETVPTKLLLTVSVVLPYFVFLAVEQFTPKSIKGIVRSTMEKANYWYLKYIHGLCFTLLITDLAKLTVGEPRPHFFHICKPLENNNCTYGEYIAEYTCTNKLGNQAIADSYKSFPSGHASFSCYTALFIAIYFSRRIRTSSHLFLNFLQVCCIFWALLCSFTRITDHMHHWWDVLSGALLGTFIALYFLLSQKRTARASKKNDDLKEKSNNIKSNLINSNS